jgi:hypothetical protein
MKAVSKITQTKFSPIVLCVNTAHDVLSTPPETATNAFSSPMLFFSSAIAFSTNVLGEKASTEVTTFVDLLVDLFFMICVFASQQLDFACALSEELPLSFGSNLIFGACYMHNMFKEGAA